MTDLPIFLKPYAVRAILENRKTQARFIFNPDLPSWCTNDTPGFSIFTPSRHVEFRGHYPGDKKISPGPACKFFPLPYWQEDRLWVREQWHSSVQHDHIAPRNLDKSSPLFFAADQPTPHHNQSIIAGKARHPLHLPRHLSRLTLRITKVRVQRLQTITENEARAEGPHQHEDWPLNYFASWKEAFKNQWNKDHTTKGHHWDDNPFVLAITFVALTANIDQLPQL